MADKTTSKLTFEVVRVKKLFQHEDNARVTSSGLTVRLLDLSPLVDGHDAPAVAEERVTDEKSETADPFFNERCEWDVTSALNLPDKLVRVAMELHDHNHTPAQRVAVASIDVAVGDNTKGEIVLPLQPPATETATAATSRDDDPGYGKLTVRWSVKVTKPAPKVVDENADVVLEGPVELDGTFALLPEARTYAWFHLANDPGYFGRLEKAVVAAAGAHFASNPPPKPAKRGAAAEQPPTTITQVLEKRWKCRRSHMVYTKVRVAAERHLQGLPYLPSEKGVVPIEEELRLKTQWKALAAIRKDTIVRGTEPPWTRRARDAVDRLWAYYATGEMLAEGTQLTITHRGAMGVCPFGKGAYEALNAALLRHVVPGIDEAFAAAVAKEDVENDPFVSPPKPPAGTPAPPFAMPKAAELFAHALHGYAAWWADTLCEDEYLRVVRDAIPAVDAAKAAVKAAEAALDAAARPSSGKKKGGKGGKKKK